jgi:hypothetical protein
MLGRATTLSAMILICLRKRGQRVVSFSGFLFASRVFELEWRDEAERLPPARLCCENEK